MLGCLLEKGFEDSENLVVRGEVLLEDSREVSNLVNSLPGRGVDIFLE